MWHRHYHIIKRLHEYMHMLLECAIENPNAKVFDPPSTPKSHPRGPLRPRWQNEKYVQYVLNLRFVRTHTKFGIKNFEIHYTL